MAGGTTASTRPAGEKAAGSWQSGSRLGHNQGPPLDAGRAWRAFAWKKARAEGLPKAPLELVRRHVARAAALGLPYPVYASIRLGTGRDVAALLLTGGALLAAPAALRQARLGGLAPGERLLLAGRGGAARAPAEALGIAFAARGPLPDPEPSNGARRRAIRAVLDLQRLPGDTVVLIGPDRRQKAWGEAARLAGFVAAEDYFAGG
ncbi:hypothetical protein LNKW23_02850 [Paralimibaculum aggregatum]|uniref:Uncharacterized protein n=1 Tax=Paralimibaculum aggregatum TaxID=3036245 RepID=A0ABQ6LIR8_9RHOB|nr:hypothetical protein [Limibaculum sp. NKW23]GMG81073.1 hypothetical protein LNKW23_02850 [Limibaculum sp. NKW23]